MVQNKPLELKKAFKPINISIDEMGKSEEKKVAKRMFRKNAWQDWYDWLTNYIAEPIKKQWVVLRQHYLPF